MIEELAFQTAGIMPTQTVSNSSRDPIGNDIAQITEEFAKLLIAQITNQDPDKPVDNTEIVTQYSQMLSTLGTIKMHNSFDQFEQVKIGSNVVGKTISFLDPVSPYTYDSQGQRIENTQVGIVTEADFTLETPRIKVSGEDNYVPIANIQKIHN